MKKIGEKIIMCLPCAEGTYYDEGQCSKCEGSCETCRGESGCSTCKEGTGFNKRG